VASNDSRDQPFLIIDKRSAKVFLFSRQGRLQGAAPALLGLAKATGLRPASAAARFRRYRPTNAPRRRDDSRRPSGATSPAGTSCGSTMRAPFPCTA
jgi:hypothetical protein